MGIADELSGFLTEWGLPISVASQAVGVALQNQAQKRVAAAQQQLVDQQRLKTQQESERARAAFSASLPQFDAGNMEARRKAEEEKIAAMNAAPQAASDVTNNYQQAAATNAPRFGDTIANRVGGALSTAQDNARRAALAQSFGASMQGANIEAGRQGEEIGAAGRTVARSNRLLPLQLDAARMRGLPLRTASDAVSGLGNLAGLFALTRPPDKRVAVHPGTPLPWGGT